MPPAPKVAQPGQRASPAGLNVEAHDEQVKNHSQTTIQGTFCGQIFDAQNFIFGDCHIAQILNSPILDHSVKFYWRLNLFNKVIRLFSEARRRKSEMKISVSRFLLIRKYRKVHGGRNTTKALQK